MLEGNKVKCICGEVFANDIMPRSIVFTRDCDFKVQACYKCKRHICIYCGDEVSPIFGKSNGEYSTDNIREKVHVS